ncbi:hypothetical protein TNCV_3244091 [Trichonephila clavipes]|nr:hypothetical protein TNCV_3244091 [Trichonephila clavipes]
MLPDNQCQVDQESQSSHQERYVVTCATSEEQYCQSTASSQSPHECEFRDKRFIGVLNHAGLPFVPTKLHYRAEESSPRSLEPFEPTTHSSSHSKYGKSLCSVLGCQR